MTSYCHRCDVTLHRRQYDVISTSCAYWDSSTIPGSVKAGQSFFFLSQSNSLRNLLFFSWQSGLSTGSHMPKTSHAERREEVYPAGIWCQNDVVSTSMRRHHAASTLIRHHFYVMCPLGKMCGCTFRRRNCHSQFCLHSQWGSIFKGKNLLLFPFRVEPILEGLYPPGKQTVSYCCKTLNICSIKISRFIKNDVLANINFGGHYITWLQKIKQV